MEYTLAETAEKVRQLADKMGSDYFPLPVILNYFETSSWDFIGKKLKHVEKTQEITDDIRQLIIPGSLIIAKDPNETGKYITAVPVNYHRLISYDVLYSDGTRCRRADLLRHAEYHLARNNTNKKPTKQYPIILQENNLFQIDSGTSVPGTLKIMYCKKPTFATTGQPNTRIINLPDDAIEAILWTTITNLFNKTDDKRIQSTHELEEAFRKIFR